MFTNQKKKYFTAMLRDTERVLYDLEFKKFVALNEREVIRKQYDQTQQALSMMEVISLTDAQKEEQKAVRKRAEDLKKQIDAIDGTISGSQPTAELPDGAAGIDHKLGDWVQRRAYIEAFISRYC